MRELEQILLNSGVSTSRLETGVHQPDAIYLYQKCGYYEVPPFDRLVPTAENVAGEIWRRIEPRVATPSTRLSKVRLFETDDLYVDVVRPGGVA